MTTSPLPAPSPLNKMGVARSTRGNLSPPPHNLPPGKATGREAKRGPAFELPPGVSGAPRCTAWWGVAPGRSRYGEGYFSLRPQGAQGPRIPPLRPLGGLLARAPVLGGDCAGSRPVLACTPGELEFLDPGELRDLTKGSEMRGKKRGGGGAGVLVKHLHRIKAKNQGWQNRPM